MKRMVGAAILLGIASPVFAQSATGIGVGTSSSSSSSKSGAVAIGGGNATGGSATSNAVSSPKAKSSLTINSSSPAATTAAVNSNVHESGSLSNVPTTFAPGLTAAGLETCLGSVSGGGSALGWGASFGTTVPDPGCAARLDARTLWSFNLKKAAVARLCLTPEIYRSMPEVCVQYLPQYPGYSGYAVTATAVTTAEQQPPEYAGGPVEVRMRKTGEIKICDDYDMARQRCRVRVH